MMTDVALENAKNRRNKIVSEINKTQHKIDELRKELARVDAFINEWNRFASSELTLDVESGNYDLVGHNVEFEVKRRPKNSKKEEVAKAVRELIEARGEPIGRPALYSALIKQGYTIRGKNPEMVLSTMLWRAGDDAGVVRLKTGGYWLKEKDWPDAGYLPSLTRTIDLKELGLVEQSDNASSEHVDERDSKNPDPTDDDFDLLD